MQGDDDDDFVVYIFDGVFLCLSVCHQKRLPLTPQPPSPPLSPQGQLRPPVRHHQKSSLPQEGKLGPKISHQKSTFSVCNAQSEPVAGGAKRDVENTLICNPLNCILALTTINHGDDHHHPDDDHQHHGDFHQHHGDDHLHQLLSTMTQVFDAATSQKKEVTTKFFSR